MYRVGFSKDIHCLVANRDLILGGIKIPFHLGCLAHSDGDVLFHALMESILGALSLGDLGTHFPDNDNQYKDIDSGILLKEVVLMMFEKGYEVNNVDIFISLEKPKLKNYIPQMRENIAKYLRTDIGNISIKAGTNEGLGEVGLSQAVIAYSYILLKKRNN